MYLPQMADDRSICPGMLCVQSHGAILENYQVKGFIKPPELKQRINTFSLFINELVLQTQIIRNQIHPLHLSHLS